MNARAIGNELRRMFPTNWKMRRGYRLPSDYVGQPYYIAWSGAPRPAGEGWNEASFYDDGVLKLGAYRNPVQISQYAFTQYALAYDGHAIARARFIAQADWLASAQRPDGGYAYPIPLPAYNAQPGWLSGMAQGEAASVLLRAFSLTADTRYRDAGVRALAPLLHDVREGGASFLRDGAVFFEEVAAAPECHILNGHIYAAFAVWEYARFGIGGRDLAALHADALRTLRQWIGAYDAGGWSCYDLAIDDEGRRHYAPLWYHHFHIAQLRVYAAMTQTPAFAMMADRWEDALDDSAVRARVWKYNARSLVRSLRRRVTRASVVAFEPIRDVTAPAVRS